MAENQSCTSSYEVVVNGNYKRWVRFSEMRLEKTHIISLR